MHFALLDDNYSENGTSFLFDDLVEFLRCDTLAGVPAAMARIEEAQKRGLYGVGCASYELAAHYGYHTKPRPAGAPPLIYFGLFARKDTLSNEEVDGFLARMRSEHQPFICNVRPAIDEGSYLDGIARIKEHLIAGDAYQVNFTFENQMSVGGCEIALYQEMRRAQPGEFGALLKFPGLTVLSRSPELFFSKHGEVLRTRPMKGTEARILNNPQKDEAQKEKLVSDEKQRAENLMIVDLLRNDMGRIARTGSVKVDKLFEVETYATVHQMTSSISCQVDARTKLGEIFEALFPCGSITGAPKMKTTEIIAQLEATPRGIYTGAIGLVTPENDMCFNVPIRTLSFNENRLGVFNVGSGVVYDSIGKCEFEETRLKGKFLLDQKPGFKVLDCFYFSPETRPRYMEQHLARLLASADALGFLVDESTLRQELSALLAETFHEAKVRIEVSAAGQIMVEAVPLGEDVTAPATVFLSQRRTCSVDPVFRHKTTNRALFSEEFNHYRSRFGAYDVIFCNERGKLTEASNHNLFLRFGERFSTPPLECGLLNGVGRAMFIKEHAGRVDEKILDAGALYEADEILLVSSIRGVVPVTLADEAADAGQAAASSLCTAQGF